MYSWLCGVLMCILSGLPSQPADGWKAGAAKVAITPKQAMWMAGYGARNRPSEGVEHELWAKALLLRDSKGKQALLVTLDLCGIDREFSKGLRTRLSDKLALDYDAIILACSHTHSGPVVGTNLITMYPLDEVQLALVAGYASSLADAVVELAGIAFADLENGGDALIPVAYDVGRCSSFGFNRRNNAQSKVPELRRNVALQGPDDHDVPVLRVGEAAAPKAVVFGFACHCTTLDYYKFCGDYAGFAQKKLEADHPGTIALFWAGCGADQNPLPRGSVELARRWGHDLSQAVEAVLTRPMKSLRGELQVEYREIDLTFAPIPGKDEWEKLALSDNRYEAARAKFLLERISREGSLKQTYPYPIEIWKLGGELTWLFLGGEVVVDYALRFKRNLGSDTTWVTAYANDVMAYIPTLRVLKEGGYEGGGAMVYYAQPGPWSENVEEEISSAVAELVAKMREPR